MSLQAVATDPPIPVVNDPLRQSVQYVRNLSPTRLEQLRRLGIETVRDLLFHFPRSYEDLTDVRPIARLTPGSLQTVRGEVVQIGGRSLPDGRSLISVVLSDGRDCLEGVWFNQVFMASRFRYGQRVAFSGKPKRYQGHWQMTNPRVQVLEAPRARHKDKETSRPGDKEQERDASLIALPEPGILPVYPLTEDLRAEHLRPIIERAVDRFARHVLEILPAELRRRRELPEIAQALRDLHFPETLPAAQAARQRFIYEEFLVLQVALAVRRRELRDRLRAPILIVTRQIDARIRRLFPFRLTADQDRAIADVCRDLAGDRPMQRLLQADVGAGKTAVAVYALLAAIANKHQAVLMTPTEVLAQQHWRTVNQYLAHSRVRCLLLTGALTPRERRNALEVIRRGEVDLVVGTQALLQEEVQFARLGLVVIDEQHKFGVTQRARVRRLGIDPHYLVMTATPIPRTVALTVFGDLDTSIIRQLPPGRQPVATRWLPNSQRERVYTKLREGLQQGRQAYVVCPRVAESEALDLKAAIRTHQELQAGPFREFRIGLLHGNMDEQAKDRVMEEFRRHDLDVLVSTSVIEAGIDVPNATLLIVEHAERFGLSQLHQLRGRVSRGELAGQCYLFAEPATDEARTRLRIVTRTMDGFALAEQDVRLRGVGEFFGTRQHGLGDLRVGDLIADGDLLRLARQDALRLVGEDAGLRRPEHALLRRTVLDRYGRTLDLAEIG
jgi:ATP-dependent DNA helicase RecG